MTDQLRLVAEKLLSAKTISLILHQKPDGDAVGSAIALAEGLKNKKVTIVSSTKIADIFGRVVSLPETSLALNENSDCFVILDCSESHRTGFAKQLKKIPSNNIVVLDHHSHGNLVKSAGIAVVDSRYCATAEIVDDLLKELRVTITPVISTALLLGIFTDTGGFRHANTSEKTLNRASRLVRYGGNLQKINQVFLHKLSLKQRKLWGEILLNLELNRWGVVVAKVPKSVLEKTNAQPEDVFGLANTIALISEAKASLVLIELDSGWRGILRTRHRHIDIGRLAKLLGGRGQKKAAGFIATNKVFSDIIDA